MYYAYNLILLIALPLLLIIYLPLFLAKKKHRENFFLRLKGPSLPESDRRKDRLRVWVHAVSVGEVLASVPLLSGIKEISPEAKIYLSAITVTGYAIAKEKAGELVDSIFYLPFDFYPLIKRTMSNINPDLLVIMETELWPNFIDAAKAQDCRVAIVNGRISDKSFPKYRWLRFFFKEVLKRVDVFFMQSALDAERIRAIGAHPEKVKVTRNLKYDFKNVESEHLNTLREAIKKEAAGRKILVAGSTHEGEERIIIDSLSEVIGEIFVVLAPRHPERFARVEEIIDSYGINYIRRTKVGDVEDEVRRFDLFILDTIGELSGIYNIADIVVIGGSFVGVGGHNVLEPAGNGIPVIIGPYFSNIKEIVEEMEKKKALLIAKDGRDLETKVKMLLGDEQRAGNIGERAQSLVKSYRGLGVKVASELVKELL